MLSDAKVRALKPKAAGYRAVDTGGLHLFVAPGGGKLWRMRAHVRGREVLLSFGAFPDVSLAEARRRRDAARADIVAGIDPRRSTLERADAFEAVARRWHANRSVIWRPGHAADVLDSLVAAVFPAIGAKRLRDVTPADLLALLGPIERRGAVDTAHRIRQRISAAFQFGMAAGLVDRNPAAAIKAAMALMPRGGRRPAVLTLDDARAVLTDAETVPGSPVVRLAMRLLALTAVRPGELRGMEWSEVAGATWTIPGSRMKTGREHVVPLARQALDILAAVRPFTGRSRYVFPSPHNVMRPMSPNALGDLLERAGHRGRQSAHGWRATFSTVMNERGPANRQVIDLMLAHVPKDAVEAAYNRAAHLARRGEIAQEWAELLLQGRPAAETLVEMPRRVSGRASASD